MSTNCIRCVRAKRTGTDLLCDACRGAVKKAVKATPGDWTVREHNITEMAGFPGMFQVPVGFRDGNVIAIVYLGGPGATNADRESVLANARLISAAPRLALAARKALALLEGVAEQEERSGKRNAAMNVKQVEDELGAAIHMAGGAV